MTPLELLQKQLDELISAKNHSIKSFQEKEIDEATHDIHMNNLTPKIEEYRYIIRVIKTYA